MFKKLLSPESFSKLQPEEKADSKVLIKAQYSDTCVFKGKRVLDIGCNVGEIAMQIAALYDPRIVIGVDIDPMIITAAINNMHKAINDEACARLMKDQLSKSANEDTTMLTEEERQKEAKLNELLQRVNQLPKSFQLAIKGEL